MSCTEMITVAAAIFLGNSVKSLKASLRTNETAGIYSGHIPTMKIVQ